MASGRMKSCAFGTSKTTILVALVFFIYLSLVTREVNAMPYRTTLTIRLCSTSLSDALYLLCKDRGFNEPFLYSGEDTYEEEKKPGSTALNRPDLVNECCRQACTIETLERYCKPLQTTRREDPSARGNVVGSKPATPLYKIVNLPYSSVKKLQVAKDILPSTSPEHRTAWVPRRRKRRKKGRRKCACRDRKHRQRRLRTNWRKVSRETLIPKVPAFQVGTTSPEPIDSIVIFPFKSKVSLEHIDGTAMSSEDQDLRGSR